MKTTKSELLRVLDDDENSVYTLLQNERPENLIDEKVMYAFVEQFLQPFYDDPQPIPDFHLNMWQLYCSNEQYVAMAAPRGHGKTTSNTIAFSIAAILFQSADFILIGSNTETQAIGILDAIKLHIKFNKEIKKVWPGLTLRKETEKEIIGTTDGSFFFKIMVRSSTQQFRGAVWGTKRPNLVLLDDFESSEDVLNKEIRDKVFSKFSTDILLCGSSYCRYRVTGTILHEDSLLENLLNSSQWKSLRFAAHDETFEKILFPGKFTKEKFQKEMILYEEKGQLDLYYREMLNVATAIGDTLFKKFQFQPMEYTDDKGKEIDHFQKPMRYYVTIDFAISEKQKADFTVFLVFGICAEGFIYVLHMERFRASAEAPFKIQETFFNIYDMFRPECFIAETEKIDKAIMPYLRLEMRKTGKYFVVHQIPSSKSKIQRLYGMVSRMTARACYFNKNAHWYKGFEKELMQATPAGIKSAHDDQADAFGMIGTAIDRYYEGPTEQEVEQQEVDEYNDEIDEMMRVDGIDNNGADPVTGY